MSSVRGNPFNPDAAELLAQRMSDLSEDHHCAGWLIGLEYDLWDLVQSTPRGQPAAEWGDGVPAKDLDELARLSGECAGWIVWDHGVDGSDPSGWGETWVSMEQWLVMFERRKNGQCDWCGSTNLATEKRESPQRGGEYYWHGCKDCHRERM